MAASPLDVFWDRFRKSELGEGAGTIETPPTKQKPIITMPDMSSGEKVARAREGETSEPKAMNTSNAPPDVSEVDAATGRRREDEFDVLFKAAHERFLQSQSTWTIRRASAETRRRLGSRGRE